MQRPWGRSSSIWDLWRRVTGLVGAGELGCLPSLDKNP